MKRFALGEIALIAKAAYPEMIGRECEITGIDPSEKADYEIQIQGIEPVSYSKGRVTACGFECKDWSLKKLPPKDTIIKMEKLNEIFTPEGVKV